MCATAEMLADDMVKTGVTVRFLMRAVDDSHRPENHLLTPGENKGKVKMETSHVMEVNPHRVFCPK